MDIRQTNQGKDDNIQCRADRHERHTPAVFVEEESKAWNHDDGDDVLKGRIVSGSEGRCSSGFRLYIGNIDRVDGPGGILEDFRSAENPKEHGPECQWGLNRGRIGTYS